MRRGDRLNRRSTCDVEITGTVETVSQPGLHILRTAVGFLNDKPDPENRVGVDRGIFAVARPHKRGGCLAAVIVAEAVSLLDDIGWTATGDGLYLEPIRPYPIQHAIFARQLGLAMRI